MDPKHRRTALLLAIITVIYNVVEGVLSITFGTIAGSIALVTFGFDSFAESMSSGVLLWRFTRPKGSHKDEERLERRATRLVGFTLFIFGGFVIFESSRKLYLGEKPEVSFIGMAIVTASIIAMPVLFMAKRRTGTRMSSDSVLADSKQTLACWFLSWAVLIGLLLNHLAGFWHADPAVGYIIAIYLIHEGREAIQKGKLCSC